MDPATGKTILFAPRILFSTAGVAGAGLDNADIRSVHRDGYPPTLLDLIQEGGGPARYPGVLPSDNRYHVNIPWQSFCSLLFRIYVVPFIEEEQNKAERKETECKANDNAQLQPVASSPAHIPVSSQGSTPAPTVSPVPVMASTLLARDALVVCQYSNLLSVLRVIHLHPGCLHVKLEQACILSPACSSLLGCLFFLSEGASI